MEVQAQPDVANLVGQFRAEIEKGQDSRERVIKASRDITATSKKIIFVLHKSAGFGVLKPSIQTEVLSYLAKIQQLYRSVAADAGEYQWSLSGANQELVEALSFLLYVERKALLSYADANQHYHRLFATSEWPVHENDAEQPGRLISLAVNSGGTDSQTTTSAEAATRLNLPHDDYLLGMFDLGGELMRFAITNMSSQPRSAGGTASADEQTSVLEDIRQFRRLTNAFDFSRWAWLAEKAKMKDEVFKVCVEKVEKATYSIAVRGAERGPGRLAATIVEPGTQP